MRAPRKRVRRAVTVEITEIRSRKGVPGWRFTLECGHTFERKKRSGEEQPPLKANCLECPA